MLFKLVNVPLTTQPVISSADVMTKLPIKTSSDNYRLPHRGSAADFSDLGSREIQPSLLVQQMLFSAVLCDYCPSGSGATS